MNHPAVLMLRKFIADMIFCFMFLWFVVMVVLTVGGTKENPFNAIPNLLITSFILSILMTIHDRHEAEKKQKKGEK